MKVCIFCDRSYPDKTSTCPYCNISLKGAARPVDGAWQATVIESLMTFSCAVPLDEPAVQDAYGNILDLTTIQQKRILNREAFLIRMYVVRSLCLGFKIPGIIHETLPLAVYTTISQINKDFSVDQYTQLLQKRYKEYDSIFKGLSDGDEGKCKKVYELFNAHAFQIVFGHSPQTEQDLVLCTFFLYQYTNACEVVSRKIKEWFRDGIVVPEV